MTSGSGGPETGPEATETRLRVFVSYSRSDSKYVQRLGKTLAELGHEVDTDASSIGPGNDLSSDISAAIRAADVVVGVLSKSSLESKWVPRELAYALSLDKRVVPVETERNLALSDEFTLEFGNLLRLSMQDPRAAGAGEQLANALAGRPVAAVGRRRWPWVAGTAVLLALVALAIATRDDTPRWSMQNLHFVVDNSVESAQRFEEDGIAQSRRAAIEDALEAKVDRKVGASMALRMFGDTAQGDCAASDLAVDFERDNGDGIIGTLRDTPQGGGRSNLYAAVEAALQDVQVPIDDLPSPLATRKLIVFVAGPDGCDGNRERLRRQIEELATEGVKLELRIVGLSLDDAARSEVNAAFDDVCDVGCEHDFVNVQTTEDLDSVVTNLVDIEPLVDTADDIAALNSNILDYANQAVTAANGLVSDDYVTAMGLAHEEFDRSGASFDDLVTRIEGRFDGADRDELVVLVQDARVTFGSWLEALDGLEPSIQARVDVTDEDEEAVLAEWNERVRAANAAQTENRSAQRAVIDAIEVRIEQLRS